MIERRIYILDNSVNTYCLKKQYPYCQNNQNPIDDNIKKNNINLKIEALYFIDVYQEAILIVDTKENVKPEMTLDEELLLNVNPNYLVDNEKNHK